MLYSVPVPAGLLILALALAVVGLLVGEKRDSAAIKAPTKLTASTLFVLIGLQAGAMESGYGQAILAALVASWVGDACLLSKRPAVFKAGILAFLMGHVAFAIAFVVLGVKLSWLLGSAVGVACVAWAIDRWLYPQVDADFRLPVRAYILVISVMVSLAFGCYGDGHTALIPAGAVAFFVSDITVALDRFVQERFVHRLVGLPLYFGAQVLLAASVGG